MTNLRIVLLTRSSRPSGAQMAWRLFQSGMPPIAVIVERRGRMFKSNLRSQIAAATLGTLPRNDVITRLGISFIGKRIREALTIKMRYFLRKYFRRHFNDPSYLSIEEWAIDHPSVPIYEVEDHNSAETQKILREIKPDIGVLTNTRRIKKEVLEIPRHGFLNLHLSELPKYAGLDSIFWALYHGEKEIGVTVHAAAEAIDRGDIVLQKKIPVCDFDNEDTLYEKALWLGTNLMARALKQFAVGAALRGRPLDSLGAHIGAPLQVQDPSKASYFSWPTAGERREFKRRGGPCARPRATTRVAPTDIINHPLRVLHLITRMTRGGAQENTLATVRGQREKGYDVTLITGPSWEKEGEILSEALEEGLPVMILPELVRDLNPWKDSVVFFKLLFWLQKFPPQILHTHTSKAGFLGRAAARFLRIPVIVHTPHGHVFHSYFSDWREALFLFLERGAARWSHRLIALTERCRLEHLELNVGEWNQWVVIPSGVNEEKFLIAADREKILGRFGISPAKKVIGFVGRLAPVKGAAYLLEAFPKILGKSPEAHLLIVGDGEEKEDLQKRVKERGLERAVTFAGQREDIPEIFSAMDIVAVPSLNEGMGRVVVEAGLMQRPVVASSVGGIPDLIQPDETGVLVPPKNSEALAQVLLDLLENPEKSRIFGKNLYEKVRFDYTERRMIEKIDFVYQELLGAPKPAEDAVTPVNSKS